MKWQWSSTIKSRRNKACENHHWFFELVGFDAADEEGRTSVERAHERVERALELSAERWRSLARLHAALHVRAEELCEEGVAGRVHELHEVGAERVAVLLEEAAHRVLDVAGEVDESEGARHTRLGAQVAALAAVELVQLVEEGGVGAARKLALLVDERDHVHRLHGDHVQYVLVVDELDVAPVDVLVRVLVLLQLEYVLHEELLQVLVGVVDAQLLETRIQISI